MAPKKKGKEKKPPKVVLKPGEAPPKRKPIPPPKCFTPEDLMLYKSLFQEYDETGTLKVMLNAIPVILRRLGLNPTNAEINELFEIFLEDDLVDQVEYWEFLLMLERKMIWGDYKEIEVVKAFAALGGLDFDERDPECAQQYISVFTVMEELMKWGEPLSEAELVDLPMQVKKQKLLQIDGESFQFAKFVDKMNATDKRFFKEPINFWKLDQKQLLELATQKAAEEAAEEVERLAKEKAKEEAHRRRLIEQGLLIISDDDAITET